MASRYLIIEFDEEASATKLKAQIDAATRAGKKFRVVGLFAKPTNYCQCDPTLHVTTKTHETILKRGKKFGWWVCTICKRPSSYLGGLQNLLKPRDIIDPPSWAAPDASRHPQVWSHYISFLSGEMRVSK